jgi:hypothetical protein
MIFGMQERLPKLDRLFCILSAVAGWGLLRDSSKINIRSAKIGEDVLSVANVILKFNRIDLDSAEV